MATPNRQPARQQQQARPRTGNEELTLQQRLEMVLAELNNRKDEIGAVLPADIPFDAFHANINQALRNNPKLLECTFPSLVNACVKSAYDGLRIDGREAAIVDHNVKVSDNPKRYEKQAQYFPMVFGIIQQILNGGEVIAVETDIIYANDQYQVSRGTNPEIIHFPKLIGDRGEKIAAYSVATLKSGHRTAIFMRKDEVDDVRKEAKTQFVWDRWEGEMWKKTVVRRHRKTLPLGGRHYIDAEAVEMFPQFQPNASQTPLPAPPKPTRQAAPSLGHHGFTSGVPLEAEREREGVVIDQGGSRDEMEPYRQGRDDAPAGGNQDDPKQQPGAMLNDIPDDDRAWVAWVQDVERRVGDAATIEAVERIRTDEAERIKAASKERGDWIKGIISDRIADIASEAAGETAQADGEQQQGQE